MHLEAQWYTYSLFTGEKKAFLEMGVLSKPALNTIQSLYSLVPMEMQVFQVGKYSLCPLKSWDISGRNFSSYCLYNSWSFLSGCNDIYLRCPSLCQRTARDPWSLADHTISTDSQASLQTFICWMPKQLEELFQGIILSRPYLNLNI